jgi:hypothetical protein
VLVGDESLGVPLLETLSKTFQKCRGRLPVPLNALKKYRTIDDSTPTIILPLHTLPDMLSADNKFAGFVLAAMTGGGNLRLHDQYPGLPISKSTHRYLYRPASGWARVDDRLMTLVESLALAKKYAKKGALPNADKLKEMCQDAQKIDSAMKTNGEYKIVDKDGKVLFVGTGSTMADRQAKLDAFYKFADVTGAPPGGPPAVSVTEESLEEHLIRQYKLVRKEHGTPMFPMFSVSKIAFYHMLNWCQQARAEAGTDAGNEAPVPAPPADAATRQANIEDLEKLLDTEKRLREKLSWVSRVNVDIVEQWKADYLAGTELTEEDKEFDLSNFRVMLAIGHNLKHQNYKFAYCVALRNVHAGLQLSAEDRASLDRLFLQTMNTKKHKDFVCECQGMCHPGHPYLPNTACLPRLPQTLTTGPGCCITSATLSN